MLDYKLAWKGKKMVKVDRLSSYSKKTPTSKVGDELRLLPT